MIFRVYASKPCFRETSRFSHLVLLPNLLIVFSESFPCEYMYMASPAFFRERDLGSGAHPHVPAVGEGATSETCPIVGEVLSR